jgi:outer membrane protein OmpA-like peptidoglycan-associated protein
MMTRWRKQSLAAATASLALAGGLFSATAPSFAQQWPTAEDMLNTLKPAPESEAPSGEPFFQSVEEQRTYDRIRADRNRQLAIFKQSAPEIIREIAPAIAKGRPRIDLEVQFDFNSAAITPKTAPQLNALGTALTSPELKGNVFIIAGHTDAQGSDEVTQTLSEQRAEAVKQFLTQRYNIPAENLVTVGYGKTRLKNPSAPFSAENRRIQIINASEALETCLRGPSAAPYCSRIYQR